jgi:hypothetical protein
MKTCRKCNTVKPESEFVKRNNRKTGCQPYCKECHKAIRVYNQEYARNYDLKRMYGLTIDCYNKLLGQQGGVCAICHKPAEEKMKGNKKYLCVDHCHDTGVVRGLLCDQCNRAIGLLKEDVSLLKRAISYLEKQN